MSHKWYVPRYSARPLTRDFKIKIHSLHEYVAQWLLESYILYVLYTKLEKTRCPHVSRLGAGKRENARIWAHATPNSLSLSTRRLRRHDYDCSELILISRDWYDRKIRSDQIRSDQIRSDELIVGAMYCHERNSNEITAIKH